MVIHVFWLDNGNPSYDIWKAQTILDLLAVRRGGLVAKILERVASDLLLLMVAIWDSHQPENYFAIVYQSLSQHCCHSASHRRHYSTSAIVHSRSRT